ncbi:MAG: NAD(P)-dependent glycerol-3-phosphate dehydrogenase [Alphaproteobacteria bacterium]|nr:NAD(P)-dependent glycerol-3-phosphate dehydrogenase [Alphaproteobacteria bacterium]
MKKIGVIGAGAWGTALAIVANRAGNSVTLWVRNSNVRKSIEKTRVNKPYLPEAYIDPAIAVSGEVDEACNSDLLLVVVPSQHLRTTCIMLSDKLPNKLPLVICSKGIERNSNALMSEVVKDVLPDNPVAILSGPNFAHEVAGGQPTATTIACTNEGFGQQVMFSLGSSMFRPYWTDDVIGTQIGGAVKNVIAIACGIALGKNLGENARAALITRGIAEMRRLCRAKGGRDETLMGLSGVGDLILTCTSLRSRNTSVGYALGAGKPLEEILGQHKGVAEGVASAESVTTLAHSLSVDMPICRTVHAILREEVRIDDAFYGLVNRPFMAENT